MLRTTAICLLLATAKLAFAEPQMLISGTVEAKKSQVFSVPVANSWQLQIEWMAEEGSKVKAGDTVVVYEAASLSSAIEEKEIKLASSQAEAKSSYLKLALEVKKAQFRFDKSILNLEKAKIDASLPEMVLTKLEYAQNQLKLTEAEQEKEAAKLALGVAKKNLANDEKNHQLIIQGVNNELSRAQTMYNNMKQSAKLDGTVQYVEHPWHGSKIRSGDMVQRGFTVLKIPALDELHIQGWLNEVDITRVSEGDRVDIFVDAIPSLKLTGLITKVSSQAENRKDWGDSAYFSLMISIDDQQSAKLIPGMSVLAQIRKAS